MLQISFSVIKKSSKPQVEEILPALVMFNDQPFFYMVSPEDVIFIGDMHPRVKRQLRAIERKVRLGMPKDVYVGWEDVVRAKAAAKEEELANAAETAEEITA